MHADLFFCLWGNSVRVERGWLPGSTDDFSVGQVEQEMAAEVRANAMGLRTYFPATGSR